MGMKLPQNLDYKTYIFKTFTFKDLLAVGFFVLIGTIFVLLPIKNKAFFLGVTLAMAFVSLLNSNGRRGYEHLITAINYLMSGKTLSYKGLLAIMGIKSIENNHFKLLNGNLCFVFLFYCKTSLFYNEIERSQLEDDLQALLNKKVRALKIVKLNQKHDFEKQGQQELERAKELNESVLSSKQKTTLLNVVQSRLDVLSSLSQSQMTKEALYLMVEMENEQDISEIYETKSNSFSLESLSDLEFESFSLNYVNFKMEKKLDEKIQLPKFQKFAKVKANKIIIEDEKIIGSSLKKVPVYGSYGYLNELLHAPASCVEIDVKPMDVLEGIKHLDNLALELNSRQTQRKSGVIEEDMQMQSLSEHIYKVSQENLSFFKLSVAFFSKGERELALLKQYLRRKNFILDGEKYTQAKIFSRLINKSKTRTNFLATSEQLAQGLTMFEGEIADDEGFLIGQNTKPVFLDFNKKDLAHLNSNCIVIGNSGAGKSYFAKSLILHLSTQLARTYILDPEGEYDILVQNLDSKVIEVASDEGCKINPFHVDEETGLSNHLHFLDEFFKTTLCLTPIAQELLNQYILEMYNENAKKTASFETLYELINKAKTSKNADSKGVYLDELLINLQKFIKDGRDAYLYKDEVAYEDEGLITSFNFSKLFQSKNKVLINSQLLLMLKHVESRVFENNKKGLKTAIIVDEAHLFFSADNTAALDFLYQIAKRIRKYNGMLVVITQNLKDFTAEKDLEKKTQAIINASQYSFIFPLHPGEVNLLKKVYSSGVRLGDLECDTIAKNKRGTAFFISLGFVKENISIYTSDYMKSLFEQKKEA